MFSKPDENSQAVWTIFFRTEKVCVGVYSHFVMWFIFLQDQELLDLVGEAFDEAFEIIYSEDGWKEEKKNDKGDVVVSKKSKKGQENPTSLSSSFSSEIFIFSFSETSRKSRTITASKLDRLGAKLGILPPCK